MFAAFILLPTCFWLRLDRELPFLAIAHSILFLFCFFSVTILCLYSGYYAAGYHAPSKPHGLSRLYHHCTAITPVYASRLSRHSSLFYSLVITPELSRPTTHVHRVITPATVVRIYSLPFTGYYATSSSPPTPPPGRHTYQLLHTLATRSNECAVRC